MQEKRARRWAEVLFVIACGAFYFLWSSLKPLNYAPDELLRYQLPEYIFQNGSLPDGTMEGLRHGLWGFSYAYYPTFLGPILSACFMKVVSLFTTKAGALLVASRFTSVLSGAVTVWFLLQIGNRLFSQKVKWMVGAFLALLPQFVFLSSYVNNDIIAVCGSAMICCAWVCGIQEGWRGRDCACLVAGVTVVALAYYNAYGWILCSAFVFVGSYFVKGKQADYQAMIKKSCLMVAVVLLLVGGFFLRNALIYDGDFLGMRSLTASSEQYAVEYLKPSKRPVAANTGQSLVSMLLGPSLQNCWIAITYRSFIGMFGCMDCFLPEWIYTCFLVVLGIGGIGFLGVLITAGRTRKQVDAVRRKQKILLGTNLALCMVIPVGLSIYYSYAVDYQAQGRYCYPMVIGLMVVWGFGMEWLLRHIKRPAVQTIIAGLFILLAAAAIAFAYQCYYLPS